MADADWGEEEEESWVLRWLEWLECFLDWNFEVEC
jgi:hypothetical protein